MPMPADLREVLRIKNQAERARGDVDKFTADAAVEMADAYERLRDDARALATRAGWGDDDEFDRQLPPLTHAPSPGAPTARVMSLGGIDAYNAMGRGHRARVLLGQLAGWAEGHQEAFELEAQMKATAEARAAEAKPRTTGFGR